MEKFAGIVLRYKKSTFTVFLIITLISAIFTMLVTVNYNMVDYLPKNAQSTSAIKILRDEFEGELPNTRALLTNVSVIEALEYKGKISEIPGVVSVTWLDDIIGIDTLRTTPLEYLDISVIKGYYKDNNALMTIAIESGKETEAVNALYDLIGAENALEGEAVNIAKTQEMSVTEVLKALAILLPIIIIILILSTTSWIEPLLFLFTIGVAVTINMGSNVLFKDVSFITVTVSPILQLAVSMDYAIFLLHSFNHLRQTYEPQKAMIMAMKKSLSTIAASAVTTVVGFLALLFMRFGIGADLGLNLFKGIILSFISVMVFLPVLTLLTYKAIDKTRHKNLTPSFKSTGNILMKLRIPFLILVLLIIIPCFLAQSKTEFLYGTGKAANVSRIKRDSLLIRENFGEENTLVLLVPKEDPGKESDLCDELSKIPRITAVVSFATAVGSEIPQEFVPETAVKQFYSENYARIIIYTDTEEEGTVTFKTIQKIIDVTGTYYDTHYITGQSATLYDMKAFLSVDTKIVNLIAIIGIFITLLITFRSLALPFILLFTIETAIWINLSFPYFMGSEISFIGYLILSTVQLGATVDYGILFTNGYLDNRKTLGKKEAMKVTIIDNLAAVLTSAGILSGAGFVLAFTTSNPIIADIGMLLGRGTLLSLTMVILVLPALLILFDRIIQKTTLKPKKEVDLT